MSAHGVRAIVIGGDTTALPVTRSLARAGISVHALGGRRDLVSYSRFCDFYVGASDAEHRQERWLDWLLHEGGGNGVLMPCSDEALETVASNWSALARAGYAMPETDPDVIPTMLDKSRTYELARAHGVETPRTAKVDDAEGAFAAVESIGYPCALKPILSHVFATRLATRDKLIVVNDRSGLERALALTLPLGIETLLTEIIPGRDDQLFVYMGYNDEHCRPLVRFTGRKLRQYPIHFGVGCYFVTEWHQELADIVTPFTRAAGVKGIHSVEMKRDARDGRLKLIECNHRFTIGAQMWRKAVADLPLVACRRALGLGDRPEGKHRAGVRMWAPERDFRAFLAYQREGELTFGRWLRSLLHRQTFLAFDWADPMPTVAHHVRLAVRGLRGLVSGRNPQL